MTVFEYLELRTAYEIGASSIKIPRSRKAGTLENMIWFKTHGHDSKMREICDLVINNERNRKRVM